MNTTMRIMHDIVDFNENKPEGIFLYIDKKNIKKQYSLIIGPEGTPYFGGFFFFEIIYPDDYPNKSPTIKFLTIDNNVRFNPNLYQINGNGKVCLSILNTWGESSWSQVQRLSSVVETSRAHLFHDKPLINEPGFTEKDPMNDIYNRMIMYQNLNFNVYSNIVQTPIYAEPFKQIMVENFITNKDYFQKYIDENKHYHLKSESIRYDNQSITYNFESLQKKYNELITICKL